MQYSVIDSTKPRPQSLARLVAASIIGLSAYGSSVFSAPIDSTEKYAWSESGGWINHNPSHATAEIFADHLEGWAWNESVGWIHLGSDGGGGSPNFYANTDDTNWGVNHDSAGNLSGFAWSETSGWINFNPSHQQVQVNLATGAFSGYAWSESLGWIHFSSATDVYNVQATPLNGICGASDGQKLASAPTTNLCSSGVAGTVTGSGPWAWNCAGLFGGNDAQCSASVATDPVTIAVNVTPNQGGTASCDPPEVDLDGSSTCTATPSAGYLFSTWSGGCTGSSCELTMIEGETSVTAQFVPDTGFAYGCSTEQQIIAPPAHTTDEILESEVALSSNSGVVVGSGRSVIYTAPQIVLNPTFSVQAGGRFTARATKVKCATD